VAFLVAGGKVLLEDNKIILIAKREKEFYFKATY
jgi:hypothetical protein